MNTKSTLVAAIHPRTTAGYLGTSRVGLLSMLLLLILPAALQAQFNYTTNNGTITITGYTGTSGDVTIPAEINGLPVTDIRNFAFSDRSILTNITIPNSVTNVGVGAFQNCANLSSVTIGDSVASIQSSTFSGCTSLRSITIPDSVTSIGDMAFYDCTSLSNISIGNMVTYIGAGALSHCISLSSFIVPDSVTSFGETAFSDCVSLTNVVIGNSVTNVGFGMFLNCANLRSVTIGDNVTSIGDIAFYDCTSLRSITIPDSVTSIGGSAFSFCSSLTNCTIGNSITTIGDYAFFSCHSVPTFTLPDSVTGIGEGAFSDCTSLANISIGNMVTYIGASALSYCISLSSFTVPDSVTSIQSSTFDGCTSLRSITIPDRVTSIGERVFSDCASLTNVVIGNSVTNVGFGMFLNCANLRNITIPDSVTCIGEWAFNECSSLGNVIIGNNVSTIGKGAFYGCTTLTNVTIGNSVTSIGDWAFSYCSALASVTIPGSATYIGQRAFELCQGLTHVSIGTNVTSIGDRAFYYCSALASVTIPNSVTNIGARAFDSCSGLTSVKVPDSVINIGDYAFYYCSELTDVTIPGSVTNIGAGAFGYCINLMTACFGGNAPRVGTNVFQYASYVIVYHLQGATGWEATFGGRPTALLLPPEIVQQPQDQTVYPGDSATFTISVASVAPLDYQWYFGGLAVSNATGPVLELANAQPADSGEFRVVVTNLAGRVTSHVAVLTVIVLEPPPLVVGPGYPLATNSAQPELALSSVFDGVNFLIGIRGDTNNPDAVGAQLLSPAGAKVGPLISAGHIMDGFLAAPRVAMGGSNYIMVWADAATQHPATGNDVFAQFVSPGGEVVSNAFAVCEAAGDQYARGVAYDGSNFLAIWAGEDGLRGRRVSPAGELLGGVLVFTTAEVEEAAAVAYGGGQYLVTWVDDTAGNYVARARLVSTAGQLGQVLQISQTSSISYNPISVAAGGGRFMLVWHQRDYQGADWDLRGRIVLTDGTMLTDELTLAGGPNDELAWANNVIFDGQCFLVVWTEFAGAPTTGLGTVLGRYWTIEGAPLGTAFSIEPAGPGTMGVGLSTGSGRVLAIINRNAFAPAADVYARFITRPFVQIQQIDPPSVQVTFGGTLQYSTNLPTWVDRSPQPVSPWIPPTGERTMFFRARTATTPSKRYPAE